MTCDCTNKDRGAGPSIAIPYEQIHPLNVEFLRRHGVRPADEQSISDSNGGDGSTTVSWGLS